MKILQVKVSNYKNCCNNFTIDFLAKAKKTSEDKEYELQQIANDLYVFNTVAIVGKNASGKTSAIELLNCVYTIFSEFRLEDKFYSFNNVKLEVIFFHENYIYKYKTTLQAGSSNLGAVNFLDQCLYRKKYYKTKVKEIFDNDAFAKINNLGELPEDTSILFFLLKKKEIRSVYLNCNGEGADTYRIMFSLLKNNNVSNNVLMKIIKIFDHKIEKLEKMDEKHYCLIYQKNKKELTDSELLYMLSSGTTKGILLYSYVVIALIKGYTLLIDEIENHFHKTLVENIISLFKDKTVNRSNANLVFTTHYCELLDLFSRQDNIWIAKSTDYVRLENMYLKYDIRAELLKSRQFYNNAFDTAVNYDDLMALKKELMRWQNI